MNDFLPKDYKKPVKNAYMKFEPGSNKFRILEPATVGNEYWTTTPEGARMPVRKRMDENIDVSQLGINQFTGEPEKVKHFWAFPVWNYRQEQVQILEITQTTIIDRLMELVKNPDWGNPMDYDITVDKSGTGKETRYGVTPSPKKPLTKEIKDAHKNVDINLDDFFKDDRIIDQALTEKEDESEDKMPF